MHKTPQIKCTCKHAFQDEKYGIGVRVTTPNNKEQSLGRLAVRCTVCGKEQVVGSTKG